MLRPTALVATLLLLTACGELVEHIPDRPKQDRAAATKFVLDVDPIMRGTVASETAVAGLSPVVVRGYGLVVGLKESGGRLMPAEVRAMMLQELARHGVGNPGTGVDATPESMLNSPDTAVVVVEGVIAPGSIRGTKFDLRVSALPGSDVTSLEGGRLYTTEMRPGPLLIGSKQAQILAQGKGNVFINPFVEVGATNVDAVNRLVGRILDGGEVSKDLPLKLRLATSSHTRARTIQSAICSTFPREPRQKHETAHGENADSIEITVPPSYEGRSEDFIELVRHVPLDTSATEVTAMAIRRALIANPGSARDAMWRFRALGKRALPVIQDLYDYTEEDPRIAALEAGAALDDALVAAPLVSMAASGTIANRLRAITLLGKLGYNPDVDIGLRPLLNDPDPDIRLSTYETLVKRQDRSVSMLDIDGKFDIALIPSTIPMIYIAQSGRPTIAIFGAETAVSRPLTHAAWGNRLMIKADAGDSELQIFYRPDPEARAEIQIVEPQLPELLAFLGHQVTVEKPMPGIGLSYGETIGAIHSLWRAGFIKADFKAEQDRVLAAILRNHDDEDKIIRPEFDPDPDAEGQPDGVLGGNPQGDGSFAGASTGPGLSGSDAPSAVETSRRGRDTVPR